MVNYQFQNTSLGDIYVRPYGECHPDFISYGINSRSGMKICVRKPELSQHIENVVKPGVTKNKMSLYSSQMTLDRTKGLMSFRRTFTEDDLRYVRAEKMSNGLGIPNELMYNYGDTPGYFTK